MDSTYFFTLRLCLHTGTWPSLAFLRIPTLSRWGLGARPEGWCSVFDSSTLPSGLSSGHASWASIHHWLESLKTPSGLFIHLGLETQLSDSWDHSLCLLVWRLDFLSGFLLWSLRGFSPPCVLHPNRWWLWVRAPGKALSQFLCPDSSLQQATGLFLAKSWGISGIHPVWLLPCFQLPTQSA